MCPFCILRTVIVFQGIKGNILLSTSLPKLNIWATGRHQNVLFGRYFCCTWSEGVMITIWYMINSCDTWSTGFHGNDQCLSYMINSLSYQWSTVAINDQQSFMAMINVYLTWSTVFHPMIDVDHAWTVMNDIVHKAMNNANCIYTLTFTFLLSSSPTSGERRVGDGCSVSNGTVDHVWNMLIIQW